MRVTMKNVYDNTLEKGEQAVDEHGDLWECTKAGMNETKELTKIGPPRGMWGTRMIIQKIGSLSSSDLRQCLEFIKTNGVNQ